MRRLDCTGTTAFLRLRESQIVFRRLRRLVLRALVAVVLATIVALAPLPWWTPIWFTHFQVPMVVFLFIATLGVLLYDTFFYDRYRN
jgi:hypothetical protein